MAGEFPTATDPFPPEGRVIHVAYESQWDAIVTILDELGVKLFEIPAGPSAPDTDGAPTYGLMFKPADD